MNTEYKMCECGKDCNGAPKHCYTYLHEPTVYRGADGTDDVWYLELLCAKCKNHITWQRLVPDSDYHTSGRLYHPDGIEDDPEFDI